MKKPTKYGKKNMNRAWGSEALKIRYMSFPVECILKVFIWCNCVRNGKRLIRFLYIFFFALSHILFPIRNVYFLLTFYEFDCNLVLEYLTNIHGTNVSISFARMSFRPFLYCLLHT